MKTFISILVFTAFLFNCNTSKTTISKKEEHTENIKQNDTIKIANDELEYEIIIIEPGFSGWLAGVAKPEGYYSQSYLESKNFIYVTEWNQRVRQPQRFNPNLYEMSIDYQPNIDYGYEVNYKLYNYFIYFQLTYKQQLAGIVPRI